MRMLSVSTNGRVTLSDTRVKRKNLKIQTLVSQLNNLPYDYVSNVLEVIHKELETLRDEPTTMNQLLIYNMLEGMYQSSLGTVYNKYSDADTVCFYYMNLSDEEETNFRQLGVGRIEDLFGYGKKHTVSIICNTILKNLD